MNKNNHNSIFHFFFEKFLFIAIFLVVGMGSVFANGKDLGPHRKFFKVDKVEVIGSKKVESEAIFEKIETKVGDLLDNYTLRRDIKTIYRMKFFDAVEARQVVRRSGGKSLNVLQFKVKEKPIVQKIILDGNSEVDEDELLEQIKTKEFSILDVSTIKNDVKTLQKFYEEKGFFLASIDYQLKKVDDENVELTFKIKEFTQVKVKKITFLGNDVFKDKEIKAIMETREESLFSFMTSSGNFKEFNFQTDIERIKYFYKSKGYLQINVGNPEITVSEDKKWVFITVSLTEGPKFYINDLYFDGDLIYSESELRESIQTASGKVYSEDQLQKDITKLTELYQDKGYAFTNVLRTINVVPGETKVDIRFSFEKGKITYFGKISVVGNTKTRDKVVRRELQILEGQKYSGSALRRSKENVNRLGFFEPNSVIFNTVSPPGKDDVLDVEITVKERNTGQISLGAGYSTSTKGFLQASISQNNFRGLGQILSFSLNLSSSSQNFNLGFTEPYLFDTKWTAGADIFQNKSTRSRAYDVEKYGGDIRIGHPIWDLTRLFFTYKYVDTTLSNIKDVAIDKNLENGVASSIETKIVTDKRNNRFEPTKGFYNSLSLEYTGIIITDKKWLKSEWDFRWYQNFWGDFTFRYRNNVTQLFEVDSKDIPRSEKFFLGGSRNLRGFGYEDIGPIVETTDSDGKPVRFNARGLFSFYNTLEIEHPLVREAGLKWVVFYDIGNIYEKYMGKDDNYKTRMDYGFGFRWFSPIGVLRFEFGYPLNKKDTEDSSQFHFDIGQLF